VSSSLRRGALAASALAFSLLSLSACAAGHNAATHQVSPDSAGATADDIKIQNVNVITQPEGSEGPAAVSGKIFNTGDQDETLETITVTGSGAEAELSPAVGSGPVTVPAHGSVQLGGEGNASAVLKEGTVDAQQGDAQPVVFELSDTGAIEVTALVMPSTGQFEPFGPSALPTASASAEPAGPADGPSGSVTESAAPGEPAAGADATEDAANGSGTGAADEAAEENAGH